MKRAQASHGPEDGRAKAAAAPAVCPAARLGVLSAAPVWTPAVAPECIRDCVHMFWEMLSTRQRVDVRVRPRTLRVGTACSGTDSVVKVLQQLADKTGWQFKRALSCECSEIKHQWLTDNFPTLSTIFTDVTELHTGSAVDAVTGQRVRAPPVDLFIAGFVCKPVSAENAQRGEHAECIGRSSGLTGKTFRGVQQFCEVFRPIIVMGENVSGLVKHINGTALPIQAVESEFSAMGYSIGHALLDTRHYMLPQRRTRCWIWAFEQSNFDPVTLENVGAIVEQLAHRQPVPLATFLEASAPAGRLRLPAGRGADGDGDMISGGRADLSEREAFVVAQVRRDLDGQPSERPPQRFSRDDLVVDVSKSAGRAPQCMGLSNVRASELPPVLGAAGPGSPDSG